jgi:Icc-related predicted phosphoesterase
LRIWPISDLHLESSTGWDLPSLENRPAFDVLVVAGDLIPRPERGVRWLLERVRDKPVVYILGNHERYGEDADRAVDKARKAALGTAVHVLEQDFVEINGVEFAGGTLWTNYALYGTQTVEAAMSVAQSGMNDFRRIRVGDYSRKFRPLDALVRHERSIAFLRSRKRAAPEKRRIIATHHSPDWMAVANDPSLLAASYASNLDGLISEIGASLWVSGHVHETRDCFVSGTRLISNPKGYGPSQGAPPGSWQNRNFEPRLTVEVQD